jgi:hypothetical protein
MGDWVCPGRPPPARSLASPSGFGETPAAHTARAAHDGGRDHRQRGSGVDPELAIERPRVRPDRVLGEGQALSDLADGQVARQEREHGDLGVARGLEQLAAGRSVARPSSSCSTLSASAGMGLLSLSSPSASRGPQRRVGVGEASASRPDAGEQDEQPRVVQGRDLVGEEPLGRGELVLGLDQGPVRRQDNPRCGRRVWRPASCGSCRSGRPPPSPSPCDLGPRQAARARAAPNASVEYATIRLGTCRSIAGCSSAPHRHRRSLVARYIPTGHHRTRSAGHYPREASVYARVRSTPA